MFQNLTSHFNWSSSKAGSNRNWAACLFERIDFLAKLVRNTREEERLRYVLPFVNEQGLMIYVVPAGEGRIVTDSNDDVENEAWSLVGRAVAHTLLV